VLILASTYLVVRCNMHIAMAEIMINRPITPIDTHRIMNKLSCAKKYQTKSVNVNYWAEWHEIVKNRLRSHHTHVTFIYIFCGFLRYLCIINVDKLRYNHYNLCNDHIYISCWNHILTVYYEAKCKFQINLTHQLLISSFSQYTLLTSSIAIEFVFWLHYVRYNSNQSHFLLTD